MCKRPLFFKNETLKIFRERMHMQTEWQAEAEGEAGSLPNREPDVGLDPRTLGL